MNHLATGTLKLATSHIMMNHLATGSLPLAAGVTLHTKITSTTTMMTVTGKCSAAHSVFFFSIISSHSFPLFLPSDSLFLISFLYLIQQFSFTSSSLSSLPTLFLSLASSFAFLSFQRSYFPLSCLLLSLIFAMLFLPSPFSLCLLLLLPSLEFLLFYFSHTLQFLSLSLSLIL